MKKGWILSGLLAIALLLPSCGHEHAYVEETVEPTCVMEGYNQFVCECGDSYRGELTTPKTAHTGMVSCSHCQISYFNEVKNLIITNGIQGGTMYFYQGTTRTGDGSIQYSRVVYDTEDDDIALWINFQTFNYNVGYNRVI